jgi:hypothetical protein
VEGLGYGDGAKGGRPSHSTPSRCSRRSSSRLSTI